MKRLGGINLPLYLVWMGDRPVSFMQIFYDLHFPRKKCLVVSTQRSNGDAWWHRALETNTINQCDPDKLNKD